MLCYEQPVHMQCYFKRGSGLLSCFIDYFNAAHLECARKAEKVLIKKNYSSPSGTLF